MHICILFILQAIHLNNQICVLNVCDDLSAHPQESQDEAKRKRLGCQLSEYKKRVAWLNQVIDELSDDAEDDTSMQASAKGDPASDHSDDFRVQQSRPT